MDETSHLQVMTRAIVDSFILTKEVRRCVRTTEGYIPPADRTGSEEAAWREKNLCDLCACLFYGVSYPNATGKVRVRPNQPLMSLHPFFSYILSCVEPFFGICGEPYCSHPPPPRPPTPTPTQDMGKTSRVPKCWRRLYWE